MPAAPALLEVARGGVAQRLHRLHRRGRRVPRMRRPGAGEQLEGILRPARTGEAERRVGILRDGHVDRQRSHNGTADNLLARL